MYENRTTQCSYESFSLYLGPMKRFFKIYLVRGGTEM